MLYNVRTLANPPDTEAALDSAEWGNIEALAVSHFRPESSTKYQPKVTAKLVKSDSGLHGIFRVQGELVRCVRTEYFSEVWKDSCVEFFVEPVRDAGYFNFEFNCGGALLCSHVTDPRRVNGELACATQVPAHVASQVQIASSLPRVINPERKEPCDWTLAFFIPYSVFAPRLGQVQPPRAGDLWRANFYKCAEEVSHPHWAAWSPVRELNFHAPECFGTLVF